MGVRRLSLRAFTTGGRTHWNFVSVKNAVERFDESKDFLDLKVCYSAPYSMKSTYVCVCDYTYYTYSLCLSLYLSLRPLPVSLSPCLSLCVSVSLSLSLPLSFSLSLSLSSSLSNIHTYVVVCM